MKGFNRTRRCSVERQMKAGAGRSHRRSLFLEGQQISASREPISYCTLVGPNARQSEGRESRVVERDGVFQIGNAERQMAEHHTSGAPPLAAAKASSGVVRPNGLAASDNAQGRNAPLPRWAWSLPSSTTMRPRDMTFTGQPVRCILS